MWGRPACRACRSNVPVQPSGWIALPSSRVNTKPKSYQAGPHRRRSARSCSRQRRSSATLRWSRSMVRRPRFVLGSDAAGWPSTSTQVWRWRRGVPRQDRRRSTTDPHFAAPHPGRGCQQPSGIEAVTFDVTQELAQLSGTTYGPVVGLRVVSDPPGRRRCARHGPTAVRRRVPCE